MERVLQLLALLAARPWWTGAELADRLETTERTVRRDVNRLRNAGYPVVAVSGPAGGYRLGSGTRLPPLLLDDEEAVAIALSLRTAAGRGEVGTGTAALRALAKLDQVLPASAREQLAALAAVTVGLRAEGLPSADADVLVAFAVACQRGERVRFGYRKEDGEESRRHVEPFRLVYTDRAWYLVAYDTDRRDWRTFRVDRASDLVRTGARFQHRDPPDAAMQVATGLAVASWSVQALVRLHAPLSELERVVAPTDARLEPEPGVDPEERVLLRVGGDDEWIARYLTRLPCRFEVLEPESVRQAVRELGARIAADHPPGPCS